jgi:TonB-dependent receptor
MMSNTRSYHIRAALLAAASVPALMFALPAAAQSTPPAAPPAAPQDQPPAAADDQVEDIVVQGYRASLSSATQAKRNATGFSDSIFAEDIGKFPDTNIAESLNRVPGVTISRDITGEGLQVTIRGLGTNFTRVLLNNAPIAVASTGRDGAQSTNREVDLDVFPTELFTSLTVNKSSTASMLEGGAAGTVNLRSARPFDKEGTRITYSAQTTNISNTGKWGYRGSVLASATRGDFGILLGFAGVRNQVNVSGYETVGLTNPNLSATQNTSATRNNTGGGNFTIPGTVPSNANIPGVAAGTVIDQAFLLAQNPGATITQIDNGLLPRLGRPVTEFGTKDRISFIGSLEYKGDRLHAYVDGMYSKKNNDLRRIDMNWVGRNGAVIPVNTQYDRSDCTAGCVVTKGTYYNAQFFLEYRPFIEDTTYWGINPGVDWEVTDNLKLSLNGNYTKSKFHREVPSVLVITPANSGVTVNFDNTAGGIPIISSNVDLNKPANFGWPGARVNIQDEYRTTNTKGVRGDLQWGDTHLNLRVGGAYDDVSRSITATDNSQAFQNAVCGNNPSIFLPSPNTQPPCEGLNTPTPGAGYPTYPALGTGFSTGKGPLTWGGSLIPNSAIASYLQPGEFGFITVDWDKFKQASHYDAFHDASPPSTGSNTGASGGYVREKTLGFYGELNGDLPIGPNRLTFNTGLRWVKTDQRIGGYVSISDPRNAQDPDGLGPLPAACPGTGGPRDGSCYPNLLNFVYTGSEYDNWLPSVTTAFHIGSKAVLRMAISRSMTRPNPSSMLPGLNFSSPSADVGSVGNPALAPFLSTNIDFGAEYYTGQEGYIGIAAFQKDVTGFTVNGNVTVPFSALAAYGVTYDTLSPTQQAAITSRGGPNAATVVLTQQVNASGTLTVKGLEMNWVQPLDFLLGRFLGINGFGFSANLTLIDQKGSGAAPAIATGIAPTTYNVTAYYERGGISARLSTTFTEGFVASGANQNGISAASLYSDDYQQWDFGSSADLSKIFGVPSLPELTFDVQNIFKARQRSYFQFANATFSDFSPGRQIMVGLRGRF